MTASTPASRPTVLQCGAYPAWDTEPLQQAYTLLPLWQAADRAAFITEHAPQVRTIATRGELGASAELIAQLPALEIISCYGVGTDAIALDAARARGIRVTNTPDVLTGDVADLAVGLALGVMRRIPAGDAHVRSGAWAQVPMGLTTRLFGKRVGIAGFGRIGQAVAQRLQGFEVEIAYFNRSAKPGPHRHVASLEALADWADVLIVTLPGGEGTQHAINAEVLRALGPRGWLVNVARGSTADEAALLQALQQRQIAGAALDVFWHEPAIDPRFAELDNVLLQPHHGSGTEDTRRAMGQLLRDNLAAHFAGQPLPTPVV